MGKLLRILHHLGIVFFLGSIAVFTAVSIIVEGRSLTDLVFAREIIKTGTYFITLPGLAIFYISGAVITLKEYRAPGYFWLSIKKVLNVVIILNTIIFVLPAVNSALELAKESLLKGELVPEYNSAYMKESIAGGVNVLLALAAIAISFFRKKE